MPHPKIGNTGDPPVKLCRTIIIVAFAIAGLLAGNVAQAADNLAQASGRVGAFPDVDRMEAELRKGVSTKADVEALLGPPIGHGGALSSVDPNRPRAVWVYGEFGWSMIELKGSTARLHLDQQLLMVYFVDDVFDGFWWHGNAGALTGKLSR